MRTKLEFSSDEEELSLRSTSDPADGKEVVKDSEDEDIEIRTVSESDADLCAPWNIKKSKKKKTQQQINSSEEEDDDDDDRPLKPRSTQADSEGMDSCHDDQDVRQQSEDEATPLKRKTSLKAPKLVIVSSDDGLSPMKVKLKSSSQESESELDTSSLSSENENETRPKAARPDGPRIKFTMKKVQPSTKATSEAREKGRKKVKAEGTEKEENPYLKRLRLICRKVGIFVRNDTHFAGCTSDKQKIERLKEALKKAGMKGQPSLSKVDSVNLKREAEALDAGNIIQSSGRPKRQPKDLFRPASPKKSLSPVKQQFSRIQDLISDSDSD